MAEISREIDEKGNISNKYKLAMAFHIWHILDFEEYRGSLDYISQNKWVLFALVMTSYRKMIAARKKSPQEVVSEIAWATGYMLPENLDLQFSGYDITVCMHPPQDKYLITPNILKHSIDIDRITDEGEQGSVLYELKKLPISCWLNLKDTIKKYNRKWEEDIRTGLYQWMGLGYQYVLDFYSFVNLCAYHQISTAPLQQVWQSYMQSAIREPLIYIAKDFPEYRTFWEAWYNELYRYAYDIFDLAEASFHWNTRQMDERKQKLVNARLWADYSQSRSGFSVNKNDICINTDNFSEKWRDKSGYAGENWVFQGFLTSKKRNAQASSDTPSLFPKTENISIDEIKEMVSFISSDLPTVQNEPVQSPPSEHTEQPAQNPPGFWEKLKNFFAPKPPPVQTPEESPAIKRKNQYLEILNKSAENPVFRSEINTTREHIEQIQSRLQKIQAILSQHFTPREMTYKRFSGVVEEAATQFYANVKTMMKRINLFDTKDYLKVSDGNSNLSVSARQERMRIYTEHIKYVKKLVDANENIISKLDGLLLELTKLDDFSEEALNNNPAVNELTDLIDQTRFYKQ